MDLNLLGTASTCTLCVTIFVAAGLLLFLYCYWRYHLNLPPGPMGYPVIGSALDIFSTNFVETLRKYRTIYGDVFIIYLGADMNVVVNGYDNLKELFIKKGDITSDRPPNFVYKDMFKEAGLTTSSGRTWKIHRAFALKTLRGFGLGKKSIECNITEEVEVFLKEIEQHDGKCFHCEDIINACVSNVVSSIVCGKRFSGENKKFKRIKYLLEDVLMNAVVAGVASTSPFLKYLPGDPFAVRRMLKDVAELDDFFGSIINEHKLSFDPENVRDYIDAYLKEQQRNGSENDLFTDQQLSGSVMDLFLAGTETVPTSLKWVILYLLHHPTVQEKMAKEIESVVGVSHFPSLNDKPNLPYCEAVVTEVLRCTNLSPIPDAHYTAADVHINGYTIPEGTTLLINLDSVMMDPEIFPEPEKFRPERFIDENGKFGGHEKVIPFSIGRRVCLGESLARAQLFLFSTSLVQRFNLIPVEGQPLPSLIGQLKSTYTPHPYQICAIKRQ